ncbi:MAG TPA: hypothetical protein ENG87_01785 [Candidatus Pacearchaeota archaeon]|nr:hypothetical protein [Candidatus Pacearchaeota archaeon]
MRRKNNDGEVFNAMKIELTKDFLKVGKWECKSVTIIMKEDYYELDLHTIKGVTRYIPQFWKDGQQKIDFITKKQEKKMTNITKKLKVKRIEFIGIIPGLSSKGVNYGGIDVQGTDFYYAQNSNGNYINFYKKVPKKEKGK